jgi:amino acid adenylation domain-containing protein
VATVFESGTPRADEAPAGAFRPLIRGFLDSLARVPDRAALRLADEELTYAQLYERAAAVAGRVAADTPAGGPPLTAVFAYRSRTAYAGVLASLLAGTGYVPLNRRFPVERSRVMLERAGCRALIVDAESAEQLPELLSGMERELLLVLPDLEDVSSLRAVWPQHTILGARDLVDREARARVAAPDDLAYLLFTSGSTGIPKGVMVAERNVRHFIDVMSARYELTEDDRLSQTFDMTFDLSVFDMFMAWEAGATLCVLPPEALLKPGPWIAAEELTSWFSVPSLGMLMKRFGMLKPERYPTLRWSLFCGEALPMELAVAWAHAAPNSILENLYGPTELTIACTLHRFTPQDAESGAGVVPIGRAYPGMTSIVVDDELREVAPGAEGELLLCGPQVTPGYWLDEEKTNAAFVVPPDRTERFYRTGDLVRSPVADDPLTYLGRIDHQIKINGYRVELGEIEAAVRAAAGVDEAVAVGWPVTASGAAAVTAFVTATSVDDAAVREQVRSTLPDYMVPRAVHAIPEMPLNANGKVDRKALLRLLDEGTA